MATKSQAMSRHPSVHAREAWAIYFAFGIFFLSLIVAMIVFWPDPQRLFGGKSIGLVASIMATLSGFVAFYLGNNGQYPVDDSQTVFTRVRNVVTKTALAFTHAAICFLLSAGFFFIFNDAFRGLMLDAIASSVIVASSASIAGYIVYLAARDITTLKVSTVLAIFLASGVLTSMITAENPYWWQEHFSSLGAGGTASANTFNLTLIIAGLVVVALSDFIANDFAKLRQKNKKHAADKAQTIRIALAMIGVFLAFVGIFVYNIHEFMHVFSAGGMAIIFMWLAASSPRLMPTFSRAFFTMTYGFLGALLLSLILYRWVGYFNLTAFELIAVGIIFTWLVVFIRQIAANLELEPARPKARHA